MAKPITDKLSLIRTNITGNTAAITTLNPAADFHLLAVKFHLATALAAGETLTITQDANAGGAYDTVLFTQDLGTAGTLDIVIPFGGDEDFYIAGDQIVVALSANVGGDVWGCQILYESV